MELTIVVPKTLTNLIILEFHYAKGHQGISCTVNMMRCYFWWIGMWRDVHQTLTHVSYVFSFF